MTEATWRGVWAMVQRVATARGREEAGCFSLEGTRLHERAWRAGIPLTDALLTPQYHQDPSPRIQALLNGLTRSGCRLHVAPEAALRAITQGRGLGDIVGLATLPPPADLDALLTAPATPPLLLVAVEIADPGNVGALVRTAHALGADAFVAVGAAGRSDPFHPKAVRTAMGSLFKLPLVRYSALPPLLALLRARRVLTVGTTTQGGIPLPRANLAAAHGTAVFMGSEYWGLAGQEAASLDMRVTIPMNAGIDSLSVNAAAAILLYAARWRR